MPAELPVLPLGETVVFPDSTTPLAIGRRRSLRLVEEVLEGERLLALVAVRDPMVPVPKWHDLRSTGTVAVIQKMLRVPDGTLRILVRGLWRIRLEEPVVHHPYLVARFTPVPDDPGESREIDRLTQNLRDLLDQLVDQVPYLPEELRHTAAEISDPGALCDLVASTLRVEVDDKQLILELADTAERLRALTSILVRELDTFEPGTYALGPVWRKNGIGH